jgi:hypothetical protein
VVLSTPQQARENIQRLSQEIFDVTGHWPFSFRAPFFEWGSQLNGIDVELNMPFMHAGFDSFDWREANQNNPQAMGADIVARALASSGGEIILMHDAPIGTRDGTVRSLRYFIPQLIAQGYHFVTVRELFMIKQAQPERFRNINHGPNSKVPMGRYNHRDFWPNNKDNWWTQDWWSCPTPPWERTTEYDMEIDEGWRVITERVRGITINCNAVITQRWTVNFNLNGGTHTGGGELTQTVNNGQSATLPTVINSGHRLTGWSGGSHTNITSNRTLTAQWERTDGGGDFQEVIGWTWDGGQITWTEGADTHNRNSSANINSQNPLTATLHVGQNDEPANIWTWATVSTFFAERLFDNLTAIEITYTANLPLQLRIGSTARLGNDQIFYFAELPPSSTLNTPLILPLSAFEAPQWMWDWTNADAGTIRALPDVAKANIISGLTFAHENYGETVNFTVSSIKLHGISSGNPSVIPSSRNVSRASGSTLAINGFNAGNLSLNVGQAGMYDISIHSIDGRMLSQTSANLVSGVNSLNIGQNIARGVVVVRIQGANATLVRRISVR